MVQKMPFGLPDGIFSVCPRGVGKIRFYRKTFRLAAMGWKSYNFVILSKKGVLYDEIRKSIDWGGAGIGADPARHSARVGG
jgi:hypothetical protein